MTVETANYINQLNPTYPRSDDLISEGDDHIRRIKDVLLKTFPAITGPVNITNAKLNSLNAATADESGTLVFNAPVRMGTNKAINSGANRILNTADPVDAQDVATKHYVDATFTPKTLTINGHPLTGNVALTNGDVGLNNIPNLVVTENATVNTIAKRDASGRSQFVDVYITSDERLKSNFEPISDALYKVHQLKGMTYDKAAAIGQEPSHREAGIIAQDLEKVLPTSVLELNNLKHVSHAGVIALLIEAIKELSDKVAKLEER